MAMFSLSVVLEDIFQEGGWSFFAGTDEMNGQAMSNSEEEEDGTE